ncbi:MULTISPECIES: phage terminase large subunit family protein [unclassified Endozoicomonas]|uniref:phage terminase large subunit family protein n=1 Tax=unclassified Endozoicomonas TaxID=2644528 RepID=UPI003BB598F1
MVNSLSVKSPYFEGFFKGLRPDTRLTVSEWADQKRILPAKATKEAGRWRTSRTPYLKEIMDCLSPSSPVEQVVFMKGAQVGGTECGNNWLGYVIDHTPGPMMYVLPTLDMAKRTSKQRIAPMIDEMPVKGSSQAGKPIATFPKTKNKKGVYLTLVGTDTAIRELFTTGQRFTPEARNISFSETRLYIAPSNAHLSFADLQLHIEVVV